MEFPVCAIVLRDGVCVNRQYRLSQTTIYAWRAFCPSGDEAIINQNFCLKRQCLARSIEGTNRIPVRALDIVARGTGDRLKQGFLSSVTAGIRQRLDLHKIHLGADAVDLQESASEDNISRDLIQIVCLK